MVPHPPTSFPRRRESRSLRPTRAHSDCTHASPSTTSVLRPTRAHSDHAVLVHDVPGDLRPTRAHSDSPTPQEAADPTAACIVVDKRILPS